MFFRPKVNTIASDEGFSIEVLGLTGLRYTQGNKTLFVDSELMAKPNKIMIVLSRIKQTDSGEVIDEKMKQKIADNIIRAFAWDDVEVIAR